MRASIAMTALLAGLILFADAAFAHDPAQHADTVTGELGTTHFPNSGAPGAQADFLRGLLLLHSFEYAAARRSFQAAERADPGFAMAYWGEALTYNHTLWGEQDLDAARAALAKLGRRPRSAPPRRRVLASGATWPRSSSSTAKAARNGATRISAPRSARSPAPTRTISMHAHSMHSRSWG